MSRFSLWASMSHHVLIFDLISHCLCLCCILIASFLIEGSVSMSTMRGSNSMFKATIIKTSNRLEELASEHCVIIVPGDVRHLRNRANVSNFNKGLHQILQKARVHRNLWSSHRRLEAGMLPKRLHPQYARNPVIG